MSVRNFYVEGVMGSAQPFIHHAQKYMDGCEVTVYQRENGQKVPSVFIEGTYEKKTDELLLIVRDASGKEIFRHTTKKGSDGMISIRKCACNSAYQDEHYGRQMRVFNRGTKTWICTVCGATQPADTLSKKELAEQKK